MAKMETETQAAPGDQAARPPRKPSWILGLISFAFIVKQSACTAVMAVSGYRLLIGLAALAAASGLHRPAWGFHRDAIRIPMMAVATVGAAINLYSVWRVRSLRSRPEAQWRRVEPSRKQILAERVQIALAVLTLLLVAAEWYTHSIIHNS
jgi:hypothetical protein